MMYVQSNKSTCMHAFMLVLPKEAATTSRNVASMIPFRDPFAYAHTSNMADKSCICIHTCIYALSASDASIQLDTTTVYTCTLHTIHVLISLYCTCLHCRWSMNVVDCPFSFLHVESPKCESILACVNMAIISLCV